jgi:o-succinylbenzoate synthase
MCVDDQEALQKTIFTLLDKKIYIAFCIMFCKTIMGITKMKISNILFQKVKFKLHNPFKIALGSTETCESIIVKIETDEGIYGFGESCPFQHVTGETIDTVEVILKEIKKILIGEDPLLIGKIHCIMDEYIKENSSAKAGIDIALFDIIGKAYGQPVYRLLGGCKSKFETDITIGINEPKIMLEKALQYVKAGYRQLKIKVGLDFGKELRALEEIRNSLPKNVDIKVDANQGWNINETINNITQLEKINIRVVEQPIKSWNIDGLAYIRQKVKANIMADESVHSPNDTIKLIKCEAADLINIKLMKSGGIYPALKINTIAESNNINCMVGCMTETKIAINAAAHLVASQKNITMADLDSWTFINKSKNIKGGFTFHQGMIILDDKPGLGVEVDM